MTYSDLRVVDRWQSRCTRQHDLRWTHTLKLKYFRNNIDRRFFAVEDLCGVWLKPQRIRMNYQSRKRLWCTQLFHFHQISKFHVFMHICTYKLLHEISLDFNFVQLLLFHVPLLSKAFTSFDFTKFIALFSISSSPCQMNQAQLKWIGL